MGWNENCANDFQRDSLADVANGNLERGSQSSAVAAFYREKIFLEAPSAETWREFQEAARSAAQLHVQLAGSGQPAALLVASKLARAASESPTDRDSQSAAELEQQFHRELATLGGPARRQAVVALVAHELRLLDVNSPDPRLRTIVDPRILNRAVYDAKQSYGRGENCVLTTAVTTANAQGAGFTVADPLEGEARQEEAPGLIHHSWRAVFSRKRRMEEIDEFNRRYQRGPDMVKRLGHMATEWAYQTKFESGTTSELATRLTRAGEGAVAVLGVTSDDGYDARGHDVGAVVRYGVPVLVDGQSGEAFDMEDPESIPYGMDDAEMLVVPSSRRLAVDVHARHQELMAVVSAIQDPDAYLDREWSTAPPQSVKDAVAQWHQRAATDDPNLQRAMEVARAVGQLGRREMQKVERGFGAQTPKPEHKYDRTPPLETAASRLRDGDFMLVRPNGKNARPVVVTKVDNVVVTLPTDGSPATVGVPTVEGKVRTMDITGATVETLDRATGKTVGTSRTSVEAPHHTSTAPFTEPLAADRASTSRSRHYPEPTTTNDRTAANVADKTAGRQAAQDDTHRQPVRGEDVDFGRASQTHPRATTEDSPAGRTVEPASTVHPSPVDDAPRAESSAEPAAASDARTSRRVAPRRTASLELNTTSNGDRDARSAARHTPSPTVLGARAPETVHGIDIETTDVGSPVDWRSHETVTHNDQPAIDEGHDLAL